MSAGLKVFVPLCLCGSLLLSAGSRQVFFTDITSASGNSKGKFADVSASLGAVFSRPWAGRGAAFGDLDNDGDLDIVASNSNQPAYVLRNDGGNSAGNWLQVRAVGSRSNRDGLGARIKLVSSTGVVQYATVNTAVGYLSSSDTRVHFGPATARHGWKSSGPRGSFSESTMSRAARYWW